MSANEGSKVPAAKVDELHDHAGNNNYDFVQVSKQYLKNWRGLVRKSPLATEILMFLVERMGKTTNAVVCSYRTLEEVTGYSRRSVASAIKVLKEDNWIQAVKVGNATAYCVNERAVWQSGRSQRKYAMFSATVIASESEQEKDFIEKNKEDLKKIPFVDVKNGERAISRGEDLPPPDQLDMDLN